MTRHPLYRRPGRPQGWSRRMRKNSPPRGLDHRTVQPIASRSPTELSRPILTSGANQIHQPFMQRPALQWMVTTTHQSLTWLNDVPYVTADLPSHNNALSSIECVGSHLHARQWVSPSWALYWIRAANIHKNVRSVVNWKPLVMQHPQVQTFYRHK